MVIKPHLYWYMLKCQCVNICCINDKWVYTDVNSIVYIWAFLWPLCDSLWFSNTSARSEKLTQILWGIFVRLCRREEDYHITHKDEGKCCRLCWTGKVILFLLKRRDKRQPGRHCGEQMVSECSERWGQKLSTPPDNVFPLFRPHSHTSRVPAVSPPCPVCLDPSGHPRSSPTRATSSPSDRPRCPPSPRLTPPLLGSQWGPADRCSTPASTLSARTWTWTYGTLHPTAAPTRSSPTTPATVEMFKTSKYSRA